MCCRNGLLNLQALITLIAVLLMVGCDQADSKNESTVSIGLREISSFEDNFDAWTISGAKGSIVHSGRHGSNCFRIIPFGDFSHTISRTLTFSESIVGTLKVEAWVLSNEVVHGYILLEVFDENYMNATGGLVENKKVMTKENHGKWEKLAATIKIPSEAKGVSIFIGCDVYGVESSPFLVDDVRIELSQ